MSIGLAIGTHLGRVGWAGKAIAYANLITGTSGLVGAWPLDDASGTVARDASTGNHPGTYSGGVALQHPSMLRANTDKSAGFGATGARMNVPNVSGLLGGGTGYSLEVVITPPSGAGGNVPWVSVRNDVDTDFYIINVYGQNQIECRIRVAGGANVTLTANFTPSSIHHAAITYDGATFKVYLDGLLASAAAATGTFGSNGVALDAGSRNGVDSISADVQWVAAYNRPLTAAEIAQRAALVNLPAALPASITLPAHWLGAYAHPDPTVTGAAYNPAAIDDFTSRAGQRPMVINTFTNWSQGFDQSLLSVCYQRGIMPMITWEAQNGQGITGTTNVLANIVSGTYDAYIDAWAAGAAAWNRPFMLRPLHEGQANYYPWGFGDVGQNYNGNTIAQHIAAWKHLHDRFALAGATKVLWVWCPNRYYNVAAAPTYSSFYPGDAYVDWLAFDAYNGTDGITANPYEGFDNIATLSYGALTALNATKPILIGETACVEAGGSKATWIAGMGTSLKSASYPRINGVCWFNETNTAGTLKFAIDSTVAARDAYRALTADSYWGHP